MVLCKRWWNRLHRTLHDRYEALFVLFVRFCMGSKWIYWFASKLNIYVLNINMEIIAWTCSNWLKYRNFNYKTIFGLFLFWTIFFRSILSPPVYSCNLSFNLKLTSNFNEKTQNLLDKRYINCLTMLQHFNCLHSPSSQSESKNVEIWNFKDIIILR